MNLIFFILHVMVVYCSLSSIFSTRTEEPLIFQPLTLEIFLAWQSAPRQVSGPYAIACSANRYYEVQFNRSGSLDQKALFVQDYFPNKPDSVEGLLCFEDFKLAVVLHKDPKTKEKFIEFGFEVYIDTAIFTEHFRKSDFKNFSPLLPLTSLKTRASNFVTSLVDTRPKLPFIVKENPDTFDDSTINQELDFVWLPKAAIRYNFSTWNVESLTYMITNDASELWKDCKDNFLGIQAYGNDDLKSYYSAVNQKKIFDEVTLPENLLKNEGSCKSAGLCVTQYNLLSPYQFQSSPTKRISCSLLSTIPIWEETAKDAMDYSEKFLVAVADVADQKLKIIVGTYENLKFPIKGTRGNLLQEMYLKHSHRSKKIIPISKIIYKIVKYKTHNCDEEKELCWFDIVVVIHNQPEVKTEDFICDDKSQEWGWKSIQLVRKNYRIAESNSVIYCCQLDKAMQKKLRYENDTPIKGDLKLNFFPIYNTDKGEIQFEDWQGNFEERINNLIDTY